MLYRQQYEVYSLMPHAPWVTNGREPASVFLAAGLLWSRCPISPGECLPVRDWIRNVAVRIEQLVEHFCQGWFLARFPQQTGQQGKMDMNNSKQYHASEKESQRLIYKQVLIIHGPFKSIHLILERKCHVSQIYLFNEIF